MENKKAKQLMFGCIKSRENGECYILNKVSIRGCDLINGSSLSHSTCIGNVDSPEVISKVSGFCEKLRVKK